MAEIKIALAGNPNSGKTTMFNELTGSAQYVGNWPGVTVEKKEGRLKGHKDIIIQDLPGIYSLSPYTVEEIVSRKYLVNEKPDAIIDIVDGTNIERNLYLTTQLTELGIPVVVALNMIDLVRKNGDKIDIEKFSKALGCPVVQTSALKGEGALAAAETAASLAGRKTSDEVPSVFDGSVEHAIAHIEESIEDKVEKRFVRWYAIKLFERDEKVVEELALDPDLAGHIEEHIKQCEAELDDDSQSIITNQRYAYIASLVASSVHKKRLEKLSVSDRIDKVVTNRWLALPIFAAIMFFVFWLSVTTVGGKASAGTVVTDWANDVLFGEWIVPAVAHALESWNTAPWLVSLVAEGIVGGVGAVLGFVPQLIILFLFLSILEDVGYMARVAFIMDRLFRKFGLSGKSFIPMLIGTGCSVPGIMASRTIESERDRRMTIMTTSFIPCGAKLPIIALIGGAVFGGAWWVGPSAYFIGMGAVVVSGIILKKTRPFAGEVSPFVMELPAYHIPSAKNVLRSTWERAWSFIKRAGTIILAASIVIWFTSRFSFRGGLHMVEDMNLSMLSSIGGFFAPLFRPLGFGNWQSTVATVMGLVAKEEVVGVFGVLYGVSGDALEMVEAGQYAGLGAITSHLTALPAYSFLVFNLLCAPCFAAMGSIKREMNSGRWTAFAIAYLCFFAYTVSLIVYQLGLLLTGHGFTFLTALALAMLGVLLYFLFRPNPYASGGHKRSQKAA